MPQPVLLLLGVPYLRKRWKGLFAAGLFFLVAGIVVFIDALDNALPPAERLRHSFHH